MQVNPQPNQDIRPLVVFLLAFFAVWTLWAALLVWYPSSLDGAWLRAGVRLAVWVLPTVAFVRWVEGPPVLQHLGLWPKAGRGMVLGLLVSVFLVPVLYLMRHGVRVPRFVCPTTAAVWLNPLLTAPFAEEVLFRGLVFRFLSERRGLAIGLVASSGLFALAHLPFWWLSGAKAGMDLGLSLLEVGGIGALAAWLYHWKRSLWIPLLYHLLNNFVTTAFPS